MIPHRGLPRAARGALRALALLGALGFAGLPQGARAQEAASAVQDVTLKDVALEFGGTRVSAPVLTVSGTGLSKDDLLAILRADGREPSSVRLARLDAARIAVPELRVERDVGGARQTAVYRDVVARGVHAGRIAELAAAGASLSVSDSGAPAANAGGPPAAGFPGTGSYGRIRLEEADLPAMARLSAEPGDGKGPWQRLYAAFAAEGIAFVDAHGTRVSLARLAGRDLSARQIPATWTGVADAFRALDPEAAPADPTARAQAAGQAADILGAVSVGALEGTDLRVQDSPGAGRGGPPADLAVERLAYAATGPEAGLWLHGARFSGSGARTRIARLGIAGASLAPTIAALRALATEPGTKSATAPAGKPATGSASGLAPSLAPKPAEPPAFDLRRLMPALGTLSLSGFSLDLDPDEPAAEAERGGVPPAGDPLARAPADPSAGPSAEPPRAEAGLHVALREAAMTMGVPQEGVPTSTRLSLSGLHLPASVGAGLPVLGSLGAYGYRDLDLDLLVDSAWNEATREVVLRDLALTGRDMGSLHLDGVLGGISPDLFAPDAAVSGLARLSASAKALTLRIENGGLYERFIETTARSLSLKPDELRKEYVTACLLGIPVILGNSAAAKAIGAAMGKFAAKPGTLAISARAKNGAGLGMIDITASPTPGAVLDKLDVSAQAD